MDFLNASVAYIQHALDDRTDHRDPLEWAMAQRNLGGTFVRSGTNINKDYGVAAPASRCLPKCDCRSINLDRIEFDVAQDPNPELGSPYSKQSHDLNPEERT